MRDIDEKVERLSDLVEEMELSLDRQLHEREWLDAAVENTRAAISVLHDRLDKARREAGYDV